MFFYSRLYFSNKTTILFLKTPLACMHNFDFDGFKYYQSSGLDNIENNKSHHKCTRITCVFKQISLISTSPSILEIQIFKHLNKSHNMIFIKQDSPLTNPSLL